MSLKDKAMLVAFTTSHWTAKKFDRKVTDEVDEAHNASKSGRFNKTLLISPLLDDISSAVGKARTYHYGITLPWDDAGLRLLPVAKYFDYTKKMEEFQVEHKQLVKVFLAEYPELREAAEIRLNTLFNKADYPDAIQLENKFAIGYSFTPIADSSDLRVELTKDEINIIKQNIESGVQNKIAIAKQSVVERADKAVASMLEKLTDKHSTFRDSLVGNVVTVMELIPSMNFDDDEDLAMLAIKLRKLNVNPALLRKDETVRKKTAKKAKKILKKIQAIKFVEDAPVVVAEPVKVKKDKKKKKDKKNKKAKRIKK